MTSVMFGGCAGFLLEIVSVAAGVGVKVKSADVRTCTECSSDPVFQMMMEEEQLAGGTVKNGRVIQLTVGEQDSGGKLTDRSIDSLLFTLGLLLGNGQKQTLVPNLRSYAVAFA